MNKDFLRQNLLLDIKEYVSDAAVNALMKWIKTAGIPELKAFAGEYISALSARGENESGFEKFRDRVFLPALINGALWLAEKATENIIKERQDDAE